MNFIHLINKPLLNLLIILYIGVFIPSTSNAKVEEVTLPNGLIASAEYRTTNANKPAILVVHGFLSTRNFLTVSNLTNALADEGYSVLSPNFSLGVNLRKTSLACEAIHTHSIQDDINEIDFWVSWLIEHGHKEIVLVGHSYGSLHGLLYSLEKKRPSIIKLIATSLVDVDHVIGSEVSSLQIANARQQLANNDNNLKEYQLSYCNKYVTPPKQFLSYAIWSKTQILNTLSRVTIPVEVILGSEDSRMDASWPALLKQNGVKLQLVEGANHFFHNEQEFDLLDSVLAALKSIKK